MEVTYLWPPWLSESYHPRSGGPARVALCRGDVHGAPEYMVSAAARGALRGA
jgi:hypothetical protein